jgi:molecular chaperone DnaK
VGVGGLWDGEKTLRENEERLSKDKRRPVEDALAETKKAMERGDINRIKESMDRLTKASHKLAEIMYRESTQRSDTQGGEKGGSKRSEDDVVDAEFEDGEK